MHDLRQENLYQMGKDLLIHGAARVYCDPIRGVTFHHIPIEDVVRPPEKNVLIWSAPMAQDPACYGASPIDEQLPPLVIVDESTPINPAIFGTPDLENIKKATEFNKENALRSSSNMRLALEHTMRRCDKAAPVFGRSKIEDPKVKTAQKKYNTTLRKMLKPRQKRG